MNLSGSASIALSFWTAVIVIVSLEIEPILEVLLFISCGYPLLNVGGAVQLNTTKKV